MVKARQIASTIDEYVYTSGDDVEKGEIEEAKTFFLNNYRNVSINIKKYSVVSFL